LKGKVEEIIKSEIIRVINIATRQKKKKKEDLTNDEGKGRSRWTAKQHRSRRREIQRLSRACQPNVMAQWDEIEWGIGRRQFSESSSRGKERERRNRGSEKRGAEKKKTELKNPSWNPELQEMLTLG